LNFISQSQVFNDKINSLSFHVKRKEEEEEENRKKEKEISNRIKTQISQEVHVLLSNICYHAFDGNS